MRIGRGLVVCVGLLSLSLGAVSTSDAIPTFARKYKTSCQTCHVAYPKLNPFGEAFRMNGMEWPGDIEDEEENTKEDPVPLGAEAYKRVFPDAVWPGAIPGNVPISFRVRSQFDWIDDPDGSIGQFTSPTLQTIMAGTLGESVAFFVGAHLFEDGSFENASVDRVYVRLNDLFGSRLSRDLLNVRAGQFIPEVVTFASNHRALTLTPFAFTTWSPALGESFSAEHVHGGDEGGHDHASAQPVPQGVAFAPMNGTGGTSLDDLVGVPFGLENFQNGVELNGVVQARWRYVAGLVNGGTGEDTNREKDFYGRLAYKFGGMALDGSDGAQTEKNWAERSVAVGTFGYRGWATNPDTLGPPVLDFNRIGGDVNVYFDNLNVFGGYVHGEDEMIGMSGPQTVDYDMWFAEANYVVYPWMIGALRYEDAEVESHSIRRLVPHITTLYRANIKLGLETRIDPDDAEFDNFQVILDFAY